MLGSFFQCDPDLRIAGSEIYFDPAESRAIGLISHGHSDHIGRHDHFYATAPTAAFLRIREGNDLRGTVMSYGEEQQVDRWRVSFHPAGHVLGSAMIRVRSADATLLYTGDFQLRPSFTSEAAEIPLCDAVVMESTYGSPEWRFPSREQLAADLRKLVSEILGRKKKPVLLAYSLGKAQEVMAMLRGSGFPIVVHPVIARICGVYEQHRVDLGSHEVWGAQGSLFGNRSTMDLRGKVFIVPPHLRSEIRRIHGGETVALTGWALHRKPRDADHGLPLSDHADFDELIDFAARCGAKTIFVTHGSSRFAAELRKRGFSAQFLRKRPQMQLF